MTPAQHGSAQTEYGETGVNAFGGDYHQEWKAILDRYITNVPNPDQIVHALFTIAPDLFRALPQLLQGNGGRVCILNKNGTLSVDMADVATGASRTMGPPGKT